MFGNAQYERGHLREQEQTRGHWRGLPDTGISSTKNCVHNGDAKVNTKYKAKQNQPST